MDLREAGLAAEMRADMLDSSTADAGGIVALSVAVSRCVGWYEANVSMPDE